MKILKQYLRKEPRVWIVPLFSLLLAMGSWYLEAWGLVIIFGAFTSVLLLTFGRHFLEYKNYIKNRHDNG